MGEREGGRDDDLRWSDEKDVVAEGGEGRCAGEGGAGGDVAVGETNLVFYFVF